MSAEAAVHLLTAEDFFKLPDPIDGGKMELIRGEVITHMPVGGVHGQTAGTIYALLFVFSKQHHVGGFGVEIGFVMQRDPDIVIAPNVSFVAGERLPGGKLPRGFVEGPPTLAVQVVSPGDLDSEVATKVERYLEYGTERVWVVRPDGETVTVHRPDGTARTFHRDDVLRSDDAAFGVEGFQLAVGEIFA